MNKGETLGEFVERLAKDIPCYYHKRPEREAYSLKKHDTEVHGQMGHFATVHKKDKLDRFPIIAEKWLADDQGIKDADKVKPKAFGNNPHNPKHDGLVYLVTVGSTGPDYQKALRALQAICNNPQC